MLKVKKVQTEAILRMKNKETFNSRNAAKSAFYVRRRKDRNLRSAGENSYAPTSAISFQSGTRVSRPIVIQQRSPHLCRSYIVLSSWISASVTTIT